MPHCDLHAQCFEGTPPMCGDGVMYNQPDVGEIDTSAECRCGNSDDDGLGPEPSHSVAALRCVKICMKKCNFIWLHCRCYTADIESHMA